MTSEFLVEGFSDFFKSFDCVRLPNKSSKIVPFIVCADVRLVVLPVSQEQPLDVCRRFLSASGVPLVLHLRGGSEVS